MRVLIAFVAQIHRCPIQPLCYKYKVFINTKKPVGKQRFVVWKGITISDLAKCMNRSVGDVINGIETVQKVRQPLTGNSALHSSELLKSIARMFGGYVEWKTDKTDKSMEKPSSHVPSCSDVSKTAKPRPPVVTIMGHVDHGKTTLLDSLRSSRLVDKEFGGITQHVGAFKVKLSDLSQPDLSQLQISRKMTSNDTVTFIDTPGHAAFSAMRSRGAHCTDIVVLVVAVEDGIMPQTLESIRFAKEARVPIIVAVNKIDRIWNSLEDFSLASNKRVFQPIKQSLAKYGIVVEEYGGDVQFIPISALKRWNLDLLQESILALSEMLNIRSEWDGPCQGIVLESKTVDHFGMAATVLIQHGCLKTGTICVAGNSWAKIKTITSDSGAPLEIGYPSDPVEVTGWKEEIPNAGDILIAVPDESQAQTLLNHRKKQKNLVKSSEDYQAYLKLVEGYRNSYQQYLKEGFAKGVRIRANRPKLEDFLHNPKLKDGIELPQVNIIIKTDVIGSLEAIKTILDNVSNYCAEQCVVKISLCDVGQLTENDMVLARVTNSVIYLFNISQSKNNYSDLDIRHFNVIYHLFDDLKELIKSKLPKLSQLEIVGESEVLQIFELHGKKSKNIVIGNKCINGMLVKASMDHFFRIMRPSTEIAGKLEIIHDQLKCISLRHMKNDVDSIRKGTDCGIVLTDRDDKIVLAQIGDIIQCCKYGFVEQTLKWNLGF